MLLMSAHTLFFVERVLLADAQIQLLTENVQLGVDSVFMVQERVLWILENVQLVKKCVQVLTDNVQLALE